MSNIPEFVSGVTIAEMFEALDVMNVEGEAQRWGEMMLQEEFNMTPAAAYYVFNHWSKSFDPVKSFLGEVA
jgi:hypothetical protein